MLFLIEPKSINILGPSSGGCPDYDCPGDSNCTEFGIPTPQ